LSQFLVYKNSTDYERSVSLSRAAISAQTFARLDEVDEEDLPAMIGSQFYDEDKQLPLKTGFRRSTEPTFLLSRGDLLKRDPKLIFDNLSLHILDIGYGPNTLLTFHRIDDEKDVQGNGNFLLIYIHNSMF
jgi:hypothetical protein